MASKIRRLWIVIALGLVLVLGMGVLVASYSESGVTSEIGTEGLPLTLADFSAVPQSVIDDATGLAVELFGDYPEKCGDFVNQLLAIYSEAKDKNFVIVFNSGGWGWSLVEASPGWWSIFTGIKSELESSGYTTLMLNYQRTAASFLGCLDELVEMATSYPSKAQDLACRAEFLTTHIPDLKVILAGESNGTVMCDRVMNILENDLQVYSIQTGPPFWYKNITLDRTLVLDDNGIVPDSFSRGDFFTIIRANLKAWFGVCQSEESPGHIFLYVKAPGHDYRWQYPGVCSQITNFLRQNFEVK